MEKLEESIMGAIREENKLAFFLPEWVCRMDPMREHGSSRSAGALPDPKDYKDRDLCVLCVLERVERAGGEPKSV